MLEGALRSGLANLNANAQDKFDARYRRATGRLTVEEQLRDQVAELKFELAKSHAAVKDNNESAVVNAAMVAGLTGQVSALKEALNAVSPNHPVLQMSGQKFTDGKPKTKLRLIYEAIFDQNYRERAKSSDFLSQNPLMHRKN